MMMMTTDDDDEVGVTLKCSQISNQSIHVPQSILLQITTNRLFYALTLRNEQKTK